MQLGDFPAEAQPLIQAMDGLIDDLRSASAAQQAFLANAAHQIKTPLAGLQAQLELHAQELPAEYAPRAQHLLEGSRRLGHLTHQLLALARSGQEANLVQEKRPVDLGQLLEPSASTWFDQAMKHNIDLGFEANPAIVSGSEWMLREMLSNLIDNALRYTQDGGTITVRSGEECNRPFLEVEDNGPGIPPDKKNLIFERFYRLNESSSEGSGLERSLPIRALPKIERLLLSQGGLTSRQSSHNRQKWGRWMARDAAAASRSGPAAVGRLDWVCRSSTRRRIPGRVWAGWDKCCS